MHLEWVINFKETHASQTTERYFTHIYRTHRTHSTGPLKTYIRTGYGVNREIFRSKPRYNTRP